MKLSITYSVLSSGVTAMPLGRSISFCVRTARDLATRVDAIDGFDVHFQVGAVGAVARIGEPDAAPAHRRSSRWGCCSACRRTCSVSTVDFAGLHVGAHDAAAAGALLAALAADEPALGVEAVAVGAAAVGAEVVTAPFGVHLQDAIAGNVAEEDVARGIDGGAFQEADAGSDGDFGFGGEEHRRAAGFC